MLEDLVTARYTHTLTVTGRLGGLYQCNVSNNKPSSDITTTTVIGIVNDIYIIIIIIIHFVTLNSLYEQQLKLCYILFQPLLLPVELVFCIRMLHLSMSPGLPPLMWTL